jgi:hypothetical protein
MLIDGIVLVYWYSDGIVMVYDYMGRVMVYGNQKQKVDGALYPSLEITNLESYTLHITIKQYIK